MLEAVGPASGPHRIERQTGVDRAARTSATAHAAEVYDIPAAPPADLLEELARAASVIDDLAARQVSVRFAIDDHSGKVRCQLQGADGSVLREIPGTRLLDVLASGSATGLAVNAVG